MKKWVGSLLICVVSVVGIGYFATTAGRPLPPNPAKPDGARPWSELCAITDCERFPAGLASFVMTNGDTLYLAPTIRRTPRCCGVVGRTFFDPETNTSVILDAVKVEFHHSDFERINAASKNWAAQMYLVSSEKRLYGEDRELRVRQFLRDPKNLSLDPDEMEPVPADPKFVLFSQNRNPRAFFSIISRDPGFFGHRVAFGCTYLGCQVMSFDFTEGSGKVGLFILQGANSEDIPGFGVYCHDQTQTVLTCPEFRKNTEIYQNLLDDFSALYAFYKVHPDERE